ncbi:Hsp70 family protein [Pendulispora albinea]|uniref:Hsp70 family protein n=1 Tax=Pendulispora albinea TaxID=2741071 RepID=A0ABZ2LTQ3_9BACT
MFVDRPVGIDLGTTNSEIALCHPSERRIHLYTDRFGRKTMPSAVAWDPKTQSLLVGHAARARRTRARTQGDAIVESIKRKMGQTVKTMVGPKALLPEEISAAILTELCARFREYLAADAEPEVEMRVTRATVTVPAYFDAPQVEATRRAAEASGLEVLSILQEPTAAAIHATWKHRLGDGTFLVYDLGGGTFDVSVVRCIGGEYQVLAIDGDNYLGGDDLDRRFAEHLRADLVKRGYTLDLDVRQSPDDAVRWSKLVHLAQEIKESLSTRDVVHVSKQDMFDDQGGESVAYEAEIGRAHYDAVVASLIDTTLVCCERALEKSQKMAGVGIAEIDHVLLVGGSTRVPRVVQRVTEALAAKSKNGKPLQDEVDTCVALGAAIHAAQLGGLRIGDVDKKTMVSFVSPLVGQGKHLRLGVRVEQAPEGTQGLAVREGEGTLAEAAVAIGQQVRLDVPLGEQEENPAVLALVGKDGGTLVELNFKLYRGDARPRASALSRPSVIAKDIALEVVRAGRRERRVLLAHGTGLPAKVKREFFTMDQSGRVVLRLLQDRLPIKTLVIEVPGDTKVGTRVDLELACDESMRMHARAEVAGQELWALVEAPSAARYEKVEAILALLDEAEQAGRALWGAYGQIYQRESERLITSIRELIAIDPDKCDALCQKLRLLVDEFRGGEQEEMTPPMHRFEQVLNSLRRIVYRATGSLVGMDRAAWEERIGRIVAEAERAYEASDGPSWRRIFNETQALVETAYQEELSSVRHDDPSYLARRFATVFAWTSRLELELEDFQPSAAEEVRPVQVAEKERLTAWLREKCAKPLAALDGNGDAAQTRRTLEQVASELERIQAALERIPSIGLVTDRGTR